MDQWTMDPWAEAIPNPSAAVVAVASLVAVLAVIPSPDPAVVHFLLLATLLLGAAVVPNPED
jgi:hypothetical protein